jgi:hypothetical protein
MAPLRSSYPSVELGAAPSESAPGHSRWLRDVPQLVRSTPNCSVSAIAAVQSQLPMTRKSRIEHIWSGLPQIATVNAGIA